MANKMTVYQQLGAGTSECLAVLKNEIGLKTNCMPFAIKVIEAMNSLYVKTDADSIKAANVFLSGMQTLMQGGIVAEDYDKIDLVKRGKTIVPTARVEAFLRACARKGYRITDTIIAVPKEDSETTYFKENFYNGEIVYTLEDRRFNTDREIIPVRIIEKYFTKFICRLDILEIKSNKRLLMLNCEMSVDEIMKIVNTSEQGFYKSNWVEKKTQYGTKKEKVITSEINPNSFWSKWTGEMVNKTIIRRALKRVKEVLPELQDTILAFEQDSEEVNIIEPIVTPIEVPIETNNVDLTKLTAEEKADADEILKLWKVNPKLAQDSLDEIKAKFENEEDVQQIINVYYAEIITLKKSPQKWAQIKEYFENEKN